MSDSEQLANSDDEQAVAIVHAQEYLRLIALAPSLILMDKALLLAQGYFETLLQCGLIQVEIFYNLNQQALAIADAGRWLTPPR